MRATFVHELVARTVDDRHHEAGHAVAAILRLSGRPESAAWGLRVRRAHASVCRDWDRLPEAVRPFVAFAGPWAQARAAWERHAPTDHHSVHDDLHPYVEDPRQGAEAVARLDLHLDAALAHRPHDAAAVAAAHFGVAGALGQGGTDLEASRRVLRGVEFAWRRELEHAWPAVVALAHDLDRGMEPSLRDVARLVAAHASHGAAAPTR